MVPRRAAQRKRRPFTLRESFGAAQGAVGGTERGPVGPVHNGGRQIEHMVSGPAQEGLGRREQPRGGNVAGSNAVFS